MTSQIVRIQSLLAGLWSGALLAIGGVAAPALFSVLERQQAGTGAGQIFHIEARLSLAFAILLFVLERRRVRDEVEQGANGLEGVVLLGNRRGSSQEPAPRTSTVHIVPQPRPATRTRAPTATRCGSWR